MNKNMNNYDNMAIFTSEDPSVLAEDGTFDIHKFNIMFEEQQNKDIAKANKQDNEELRKYNNPNQGQIVPMCVTPFGIMVGIKDTFFGILTDFLTLNFDSILTKENRLYYLGIILIIIVCIIFMFDYIFTNTINQNTQINTDNDQNDRDE